MGCDQQFGWDDVATAASRDTCLASRVRRSCCNSWSSWAIQPAAPPHRRQPAQQPAALRPAAHHPGPLQQVVVETPNPRSSQRLLWRWGQPRARANRVAAPRSCEDEQDSASGMQVVSSRCSWIRSRLVFSGKCIGRQPRDCLCKWQLVAGNTSRLKVAVTGL